MYIVNQGGPTQFQDTPVDSFLAGSSSCQIHSSAAAFSWACGSNSAGGGEAAVAAEGSLHIQAASTAVGPQLSPIVFREQGKRAGSELQAGSQSTKKIINLLICMPF